VVELDPSSKSSSSKGVSGSGSMEVQRRQFQIGVAQVQKGNRSIHEDRRDFFNSGRAFKNEMHFVRGSNSIAITLFSWLLH
jgi:hypothetical protein